jgi:cell division protein FtsL
MIQRQVFTRVGAITIVVLLLLQVIVSNQLATKGLEIADIEKNIGDLRETNTRLSQEVASSSALLAISEKAHELGFTTKLKPVYFHKDQPVALELH